MVRIITNTLSESLNTKISVSKVDVSFFNKLIFNDVFIADQIGDTLIYVNELSANITGFSYKEKKANISTLHFYKPHAVIKKNKDGLNFDFLSEALNKNKSEKSWDITLGIIIIEDGVTAYISENIRKKEFAINYRDILVSKLNIEADNFSLGDTTSFNIKSMDLIEKSGARIQKLKTIAYVSNGLLHFEDLEAELPNSTLNTRFLNLIYNDSKDFKDFNNNVILEVDIIPSNISFKDIAYFDSSVRDLNEALMIKGYFKGKTSDLRAKNVEITYNNDTKLKGSFSLVGLPNVEKSFIYADIDEFTTSKIDIESIKLPKRWVSEPIQMPNNFDDIGHIEYKGNLTGFLNDFVAYGVLQTDFGMLSTDLGVKKNGKNDFEFRGDIHTENLNPQNITSLNSLIKETNLTLSVNGHYNSSGLLAEIEGVIDSINFNDYIYHNVEVNGLLTDKKFDGLVNIFDENIELEFSGRFDFSADIPEFNFNSVVSNARLDKLNIYNKDSLPSLSFTMQSNFIGSDPDNLKGEVILWETKYKTASDSIYMDEFYLTANQEDTINSLIVNSSLADIEVFGDYKFITLGKSLNNFFYSQFPSFSKDIVEPNSSDSIEFSIHLKDINPICKTFLPYIDIKPNSRFNGDFFSSTNTLNLDLNIPGIKIYNTFFDSLRVDITTEKDSLNITAYSDDVSYKEISFFPNLTLLATTFTDSINFDLNWDNKDSIAFKGDLISQISFEKSKSEIPEISINLNPSSIVISDSTWNLSASQIINDSTYFSFENFNLHNDYQQLFLDGEISEDSDDTLLVRIKDLPLANINRITGVERDFFFDGKINGESSLTNIYKDVIFSSKLDIENFTVNGKEIGDTKLDAIWNNTHKRIDIIANSKRGNIKPLVLNGFYVPNSKEIDFDITLDKLHVSVFHSFIEEYVSELNGIISDNVRITGTTVKPVLNGRLKLQKVSFLYDYLNTRYNFSDYIDVVDNVFHFKDISVYDTRGEKGQLNGTITNEYFKNMLFDININANNMTFLNTREADNSLYFGNAYASGLIEFKGDLKDIVININAKTNKNTRFFIPLDTESEIEENSFVTFVSNVPKISDKEISTTVDLSGIQLNFELEITPDAEVQLIFNSKVGDIIKGYGNSNLKLEINPQGEFKMFGEYTIEKGEYLFVLANIISKKFKVKPGGTINWDGDPYNATINLESYYSVKTSLQELYNDTSEAYTKLIPVECLIFMKNKLMNPEFDFAINLPKSGETEKAQINSMSQDELNKQFISLLFINRFQPLPGLNVSGNTAASNYSFSESTSELLSNQLSHWLSQISDDFDVGFKYRPGDEISTSEVEVALETQLFNDRLRINGNVGMGGQYAKANTIVGDVEADLKLTDSGKVRIKAFSKSNTNFDYDKGPTTQGVGLFYREEFDNFNDLLRKYFHKSKLK